MDDTITTTYYSCDDLKARPPTTEDVCNPGRDGPLRWRYREEFVRTPVGYGINNAEARTSSRNGCG